MGLWELGVGNESSWAVMNVLIQVCFDEIPPGWSQITEQNSQGLLTTVMKATRVGSMATFEDPFRIHYSVPSLPYFPCDHWVGWNLMRASTFAQMFKAESSRLSCLRSYLRLSVIHPEWNLNKWDIIYCCEPKLERPVLLICTCAAIKMFKSSAE